MTLDCNVRSNPSQLAIEWFRDKHLLSNTHKYQILANHSLVIRNLQKSDRGQFHCTCNNTLKKATSSPVQLEIMDLKRVDMMNMNAMSLANEFVLPCKALEQLSASELRFVKAQVTWHKLNARMPDEQRFSVDPVSGSLRLRKLRVADSGLYLCRVNETSMRPQNLRSKTQNVALLYSNERPQANGKIIKLIVNRSEI